MTTQPESRATQTMAALCPLGETSILSMDGVLVHQGRDSQGRWWHRCDCDDTAGWEYLDEMTP